MTKSAAAMRIGVLDSAAPNACIALGACLKRERVPEFFLTLLDGRHRLTDRGARHEVERDRHRGELTRMVDDEGRDLHRCVDQRGQRYLLPARRFDIDAIE